MIFITGIFQEFCLRVRNTYLKEHLRVAATAYFNREAKKNITPGSS